MPPSIQTSAAEQSEASQAANQRHAEVVRDWTPTIHDAGAGFDTFGAHPDWVRRFAKLGVFFYEKWFRVTSYDAHRIPTHGPGILASNHSGNLPVDGMMIWMDVLHRTGRLLRPIGHHFIPNTPILATLAARMGVVGGTRTNVHYLLSQGELILIFPEGVSGVLKGWKKRYQLLDFTVGHAEFALRHRVPVIPIGVVGGEEQLPAFGTIPLGLFGIPRVAIPALPFFLPVHYHIHYGEPIRLHDSYPAEAADYPEALQECTLRIRSAIRALIDEGLRNRKGVFR